MERGCRAERSSELAETWRAEPGPSARVTHGYTANDIHMWGAWSLLELSSLLPAPPPSSFLQKAKSCGLATPLP